CTDLASGIQGQGHCAAIAAGAPATTQPDAGQVRRLACSRNATATSDRLQQEPVGTVTLGRCAGTKLEIDIATVVACTTTAPDRKGDLMRSVKPRFRIAVSGPADTSAAAHRLRG